MPSDQTKLPPVAFAVNQATEGTIELLIYDAIGSTVEGERTLTAAAVADQLNASPEAGLINVRISSTGGSVFHALAIVNALNRHDARVEVDIEGMALSAAAYIATAGDEVRATDNSLLMIHRASGMLIGDADDARRFADELERVDGVIAEAFMRRMGKSKAAVLRAMSDETWFTAAEAKAAGLVDRILPPKRIAACASIDPEAFHHPPAKLADLIEDAKEGGPTMAKANYDEIVGACRGIDPKNSDDARFIVAQLQAGASAEQARDNWTDALKDRATANAASAAAQGADPPGDRSSGRSDGGGGDAAAEWTNAITQCARERGVPRHQAAMIVNRENPGLRQRVLDEANGDL